MQDQMTADYGLDFTQPGSLRKWDRATGPKRSLSVGEYVSACRRLGADGDSRLVAVGHDRLSPRKWIEEGHYESFLAAWNRQPRPGIVGSCYNTDPDTLYWADQAGVPEWVANELGARILPRGRAHARPYVARRRYRRLLAAAKASRRRATCGRYDLRVLAALSRFSPEAHRAIVEQILYPLEGYVRMRHVDWRAACDLAEQIDSTPQLQIAWAEGRRRIALAGSADAAERALLGCHVSSDDDCQVDQDALIDQAAHALRIGDAQPGDELRFERPVVSRHGEHFRAPMVLGRTILGESWQATIDECTPVDAGDRDLAMRILAAVADSQWGPISSLRAVLPVAGFSATTQAWSCVAAVARDYCEEHGLPPLLERAASKLACLFAAKEAA